MTDPTMTGLAKRRAELTAEAHATDAALRRILTDIEHLDRAMRLCDPAYRPHKVIVSRAEFVDVSRTALGILRQAEAPMTARDITYGVMAKQGGDATDAKTVRSMIERVRVALLRQRKNGTLRSEQGPGQLVLWEVAS
jgi:hypothetical protein